MQIRSAISALLIIRGRSRVWFFRVWEDKLVSKRRIQKIGRKKKRENSQKIPYSNDSWCCLADFTSKGVAECGKETNTHFFFLWIYHLADPSYLPNIVCFPSSNFFKGVLGSECRTGHGWLVAASVAKNWVEPCWTELKLSANLLESA